MYTVDNNTVTGSEEDDLILGDQTGASQMDGRIVILGAGGNDRLKGSSWTISELHGGDGNDTLTGGAGQDIFNGDDGDDLLTGLSRRKKDEAYGGEGNDTFRISGLIEADGGAGDDVFMVSNTRPAKNPSGFIAGGDGYDTIIIAGNLDLLLSTDCERVVVKKEIYLSSEVIAAVSQLEFYQTNSKNTVKLLDQATLTSDIFTTDFLGSVDGSSKADVIDFSRNKQAVDINGHGGNDRIFGAEHGSTLLGMGGSDTIHGGSGDDTIDVGHGRNLAKGGAGDDRFSAGDIFSGVKGTLKGQAGDDVFDYFKTIGAHTEIVGGSGNDILYFEGTIGRDCRIDVEVMVGEFITATPELLTSIKSIETRNNGGQLTISLSEGGIFKPQRIEGGGWQLNGSKQDDLIDLSQSHAHRGWSNVLLGNGDDVFKGTRHHDSVIGGTGRDRFIFDDHAGKDAIGGFYADPQKGDILDFSDSDIIENWRDLKAHTSTSGDKFIIAFGDTTINIDFMGNHVASISDIDAHF